MRFNPIPPEQHKISLSRVWFNDVRWGQRGRVGYNQIEIRKVGRLDLRTIAVWNRIVITGL